jgi:hypothetical protein
MSDETCCSEQPNGKSRLYATRSNKKENRPLRRTIFLFSLLCSLLPTVSAQSVARQWDEVLLEAIRKDFARPTIHARNLWHMTIAIWDGWAVYDPTTTAVPILTNERIVSFNIEASREETISYACYRILRSRFETSPGRDITLPLIDQKMNELGYDPSNFGTVGNSPAAVGNRIASYVLYYGLLDGANEAGDYGINNGYAPVNPLMFVDEPSSTTLLDPNRWQPLALDFIIDQGGNPLPLNTQVFLGPHWGQLPPFALSASDLAPGKDFVYHDPGPPPQLGGLTDQLYKDVFVDVVVRQSVMSPDFNTMIDIGPGAIGNNPIGTCDGAGHPLNPVTNLPYQPNLVKLGDWTRCIAEFWADGPDSETPPGHWNTLANYVTDNIAERRIGGVGPVVNPLEWDVKLYLALNGAVYDAAVAAWGIKGWYDYIRPISAIRHMCKQGQSSDSGGPSYHPDGIPLQPGIIEVITAASSAGGERHEHLAEYVGEIAILGWPGVPVNPDSTYSGVAWIRGINWLPYQRETFVTPPFAGYISGHSTFSRAAAEVLTGFTGSSFFPFGLGTFICPQNEFLVFEDGPSEDLTLTWATYYDASDESGISRIYGGIHPTIDDYPGRLIGSGIGIDSWTRAQTFYDGTANDQGRTPYTQILHHILGIQQFTPAQESLMDQNGDQRIDVADLTSLY